MPVSARVCTAWVQSIYSQLLCRKGEGTPWRVASACDRGFAWFVGGLGGAVGGQSIRAGYYSQYYSQYYSAAYGHLLTTAEERPSSTAWQFRAPVLP